MIEYIRRGHNAVRLGRFKLIEMRVSSKMFERLKTNDRVTMISLKNLYAELYNELESLESALVDFEHAISGGQYESSVEESIKDEIVIRTAEAVALMQSADEFL